MSEGPTLRGIGDFRAIRPRSAVKPPSAYREPMRRCHGRAVRPKVRRAVELPSTRSGRGEAPRSGGEGSRASPAVSVPAGAVRDPSAPAARAASAQDDNPAGRMSMSVQRRIAPCPPIWVYAEQYRRNGHYFDVRTLSAASAEHSAPSVSIKLGRTFCGIAPLARRGVFFRARNARISKNTGMQGRRCWLPQACRRPVCFAKDNSAEQRGFARRGAA